MSGMRKLVSFVDSTRVELALTLAFLVSLAWVFALALLLRTTATHSLSTPGPNLRCNTRHRWRDRLLLEIKTAERPAVGPSASPKTNVVSS